VTKFFELWEGTKWHPGLHQMTTEEIYFKFSRLILISREEAKLYNEKKNILTLFATK